MSDVLLQPGSGDSMPIVCTFESRRADEMCSLIVRHGGSPVSAPSMREIPIGDNPVALQFIRDCIADRFACVILLTGVGTEALFEVARTQSLDKALHAALQRTVVAIRGPKPATVLHKMGLKFDLKAPEPNTWRELLDELDRGAVANPDRFAIAGKNVAVQEYGLPNRRFYEGLQNRNALVTAVPVYRWALPEDVKPLQSAIQAIARGTVGVVLFTSANQVANVLMVAEQMVLSDDFRAACRRMTVASIGPTCSEAMQDNGLPVSYEASPPKMGPLVRGAIDAWRAAAAAASEA